MKKNSLLETWRLNDPIMWFMKAGFYSSAVSVILNDYLAVKDGDKIGHWVSAVNSTPYLTALSSELYMKGYLTYKKVPVADVVNKKHNLQNLREMCASYGDERFSNDSLVYFIKHFGAHIMENGGIRYPDKIDVAVLIDDYPIILKNFSEISGDISKELHPVGPKGNFLVTAGQVKPYMRILKKMEKTPSEE